jgi:DNA-binding transcriptional regulator YiaG
MEVISILRAMRTLLQAEFVALLARANVSQAAFARLTDVSARQVNNWCRGRAVVPTWAALLAITLQQLSPETLTIQLEEADVS